MAGPISIAILADAGPAVRGLADVGKAGDDMGAKMASNAKHLDSVAGATDKVGGNAQKLAGAMGDIGGGLAALGITGADKTLTNVGIAMQFMAGAADIAVVAHAALTSGMLAGKIAAIGSAIATGAMATATGVMTAAQWLLNVAMSANPLGLVIIAIIAVVAALIYAYKNSETFRNIVTAVMNAVGAAFTWLWNVAKTAFGLLSEAVSTVWQWIKEKFTAGVAAVLSIFDGIKGVYNKAIEVTQRIISAFTEIPGKLADVGQSIMRGLADGIQAGIRWVRDKIAQVTAMIPDTVKSILGISSPSKVMAGIGRNVVDGLASGIRSALPTLARSMSGVAATVTAITPGLGLDLSASASTAQAMTAASSGARVVNVNVSVGPASDPAEVGRQVVKAVRSYEASIGRTVLVAA